MHVTCKHCNTRLTIPDHKVPVENDAVVKCPRCKGKVTVPASGGALPEDETTDVPFSLSSGEHQSAMVCINAQNLTNRAKQALSRMGFMVDFVSDAQAALNKMEYHIYHLVLIDEAFDQGSGLDYIVRQMNTLDMSLRRRICLILISKKFRTNDNMAALHSSVNGIIREDDIEHLEAFLIKMFGEHQQLYTVYNESLKQAGKA